MQQSSSNSSHSNSSSNIEHIAASLLQVSLPLLHMQHLLKVSCNRSINSNFVIRVCVCVSEGRGLPVCVCVFVRLCSLAN